EKEWELMEKPIEQANQSLKAYDRRIDRSVHDVTRTVMYTITDTKTNEVIAEYPPKKIQDMIAKMWELAGLFVDEKA
ncbi:MAG: flagellar protein FlaG, partial [Fibrobacterota bacterium]